MTGLERIARFTARDFEALGLEQLAYVKPVKVDGRTACAVHAADGTELAVRPARGAVRQTAPTGSARARCSGPGRVIRTAPVAIATIASDAATRR